MLRKSQNKIHLQYYTVNQHISEPMQFKAMLFNGQLYSLDEVRLGGKYL